MVSTDHDITANGKRIVTLNLPCPLLTFEQTLLRIPDAVLAVVVHSAHQLSVAKCFADYCCCNTIGAGREVDSILYCMRHSKPG